MTKNYQAIGELSFSERVLLFTYYLAVVLAGFAFLPVLWAQEPQPSGREMVEALHAAFGEHHARAVHAKGSIVSGFFVASREAANYTIAPHLQSSSDRIPVIARFSDFTGIPDIPDADPHGSPKGFAVRFILPDGEITDIVNHSFNGFPVSNAADFAVLLHAIGRAGAAPSQPADLEGFLASHPVAKSFLTSQKPSPLSWATTPYFGVNAFRFTNARGQSSYIRYRFVPVAEPAYVTPEQTKTLSPDYLSIELKDRLARGPVQFRMQAQIAEPGDDFRDPSISWPESRRCVDLGLLTLQALVTGEDASRNLQFEPGSVVPGIATADPMLDVRKAAYPVSASERQ